MALVERLCQVDSEPVERHIATHEFCEGLFSVLGGYHTVSELKAHFNMTTGDEAEMDTLVSRLTAHPDDHRRDRAVHRVYSILTFWEGEIPGYVTVSQIRAWLNSI